MTDEMVCIRGGGWTKYSCNMRRLSLVERLWSAFLIVIGRTVRFEVWIRPGVHVVDIDDAYLSIEHIER